MSNVYDLTDSAKITYREAHRSITPCLPAVHALSGCDIIPTYFGIGKGAVFKNLIAAPNSLSLFGCLDVPLSDVVYQATKFIGACYGSLVGEETMSDIRYKVWRTKFGNTATLAPKIQALSASYYRSFRREREDVPPSDRHLESSTVLRSTCS